MREGIFEDGINAVLLPHVGGGVKEVEFSGILDGDLVQPQHLFALLLAPFKLPGPVRHPPRFRID